jgi:hypothetical protein
MVTFVFLVLQAWSFARFRPVCKRLFTAIENARFSGGDRREQQASSREVLFFRVFAPVVGAGYPVKELDRLFRSSRLLRAGLDRSARWEAAP